MLDPKFRGYFSPCTSCIEVRVAVGGQTSTDLWRIHRARSICPSIDDCSSCCGAVPFSVPSKHAEARSAGSAGGSVGTQNTNFYSFCQPVELLYDTVPTPSSKTTGAAFTWSNGEPRPLKYQPPRPTRSSRLRSFQERHDRRRWWRLKDWNLAPSRRTERVPMRGRRGGREPEVERRTLLRNRRGHWS